MKPGLQISVVHGRRSINLVISIDVVTLARAVELSPALEAYDEETQRFVHPKILCSEGFAKDVVRELEREQENGTTPVHRLIDQAALAAIENGSEHAELMEDGA